MVNVEELVKQCMNSGWFRTEEAARRYVMANCIPKPEPEYPHEEVFEASSNEARIEQMASTEGL